MSNKMTVKDRLKTYRKHPGSFLVMLLVMLGALLTFSVLLFLIAYILINGVPHIKLSLFEWNYTSENASVVPALINTIVMTILSLLIAVPFGIFSAIFLVEYSGKISISVEKKDAVTEEKLEGVIFGLYAKEDILSQQGEVLVEKDTLLEKKATDEKGQLTFDSDLYHGKYYVKEEVRKPGYLPNEEIWEIDASYIDQNLAEIKLIKEVENQPMKSQFTKTDATTGEELEGAKLQIIDQDGNIVEEWISTKEPHVVYGLPEGTYTLHEELPPYAEGYVSAEDMEFEVKEDGSVTKVEMKDTYSKVEISKTDLTTGKELEGAKLQILNKEGEVLEEWVTDGKPHLVEKLPVGEELILREITAPEGYEIAEDVKFTLEDTMEVQKVEMKDARTPETPGVPQTGDDHWKQILLFALLGVSAAGLMATMLYKKRHKKADEAKKEE